MNDAALQKLQDSLSRLDSARTESPGKPAGARSNEPDGCSWQPTETEVHERIRNIGKDIRPEATRTYLNLDHVVQQKENGDVIVGLDAFAGNLWGTQEMRDSERLREAMCQGYSLDRMTVDCLCDGPNWIGDARAWVTPDEMVTAIGNVREGKIGNRVWEHLDRESLASDRDQEPTDWYDEQRFQHLYELEHASSQQWPSEARTAELERMAETPEHRIAGTADIHPTARIGRGVSIGEQARVGVACDIEPGARVESGATVPEGARIPAGAVVRNEGPREPATSPAPAETGRDRNRSGQDRTQGR